jgi:Ca-activated chloride channel family protein
MVFAHKYFLLLLALLPVLAWLKGKRGAPPAFLYSSLNLVEGLTGVRRSRSRQILAALRWVALAALIIALAQPLWTKSMTQIKASGIDIAVALDLSGSMRTQDYIVDGQGASRFDVAKAALKKFVAQRPDDRIGLVVFAAQSFIASPMTLDHDYLLDNIERLEIGTINSDATAIGDGLTTALNRLRNVKAKSKIIVLMTDGANNSGRIDPITATEAAQALGVKIYTIGLGNKEYVEQNRMPSGFLPDEDGLKKIAQMTGGQFYRGDNSEKLREIYDEIDKMEKTEAVVSKYTQFRELFPWFLGSGAGLLLLEILLAQTVFRRLP